MFDDWKRERQIRRVLTGLARQRVALVLQPEGVWVIEKAVTRDENTEPALMTCHMRGWIEVLQDSVPTGDLPENLKLTGRAPFSRSQTIYRLTDSGWNAINRAHAWTITGVVIAIVTLIATFIVTA